MFVVSLSIFVEEKRFYLYICFLTTLIYECLLTRVFNKSNDSPPWGTNLTTVLSQEVKRTLFIVKTVFRRINLSFIKLVQWSK